MDELAIAIWQNYSNDEVWDAIMAPGKSPLMDDVEDVTEVVADLLELVERTPSFAPGDLTHDQAVAAIRGRWAARLCL